MATDRRLMVMRHAKSSWKHQGLEDHERPLNKRGRRDAPRVAQRLAELSWVPEAVVGSDSQRTRETWALMEPVLPPVGRLTFTRELYMAGIDELIAEVSRLPPEVTSALVLGHNPGWESAVEELVGQLCSITTANVALLSGAGETWADALARRPWRLQEVIRPKELPA